MPDVVKVYELRNMVELAYWTLTPIDPDAADVIFRAFGHWDDRHQDADHLRAALAAYNKMLDILALAC